jgi:hypothetical protein
MTGMRVDQVTVWFGAGRTVAGLLEDREIVPRLGLPTERFQNPGPASGPHCGGAGRIVHQVAHCRRKTCYKVPLAVGCNQVAVDAIADHVKRAAPAGCDHWNARGQRLHTDVAASLAQGWQQLCGDPVIKVPDVVM